MFRYRKFRLFDITDSTNSINNRTFLVSLNDSAQTLHVFLTAVQLPLGLHSEHAHGPSSQATRRDAETLYRVLLTAFVSLFCCLVILSALLLVVTLRHRGRDRPFSPHHDITSLHHHQHHHHHHQLQQQQQQRGRGGGGRCRRFVVGLYLLLRAVYSLAFTFSGLLMACRLLTAARSTSLPFNRVLGEESVVQVLTTATRPLHRRLAELERLGGLSWKLSCKLSPKLS